MPKPYFDPPLPHRLAHRGATLGGQFDENTWLAFAAALGQGATHIETDVQVTSDGIAVLFHDDDLLRVGATPLTPGKKLVSEYDFETISSMRLARGGRISSLADTLAEFPEAKFNIDVKTRAGIAAVAQVVNEQNAHQRVLISSFSDQRRRATLALLEQPTATGSGSSVMLKAWFAVVAARVLGEHLSTRLLRLALRDVDAIQAPLKSGPFRFDRADFIRAARELGVAVHFWVINDRHSAERLVGLGASGLISDDLPSLGL